MFNIVWEFIINLLESFLFAVICNAKFTKRQYHYHTAEQTLFILCKSLLITLMNISKISTIISLTSVLLLNIIFLILFFVNPIFNSFFVSFIYCLILAYSARTAHPFQRNGAPFRFKLSKAQQVD